MIRWPFRSFPRLGALLVCNATLQAWTGLDSLDLTGPVDLDPPTLARCSSRISQNSQYFN